MADGRIKISDGRKIQPKNLCFACKNGEFYLTSPRKIIEYLGVKMYEEVWKCDNCDGVSKRRRSA